MRIITWNCQGAFRKKVRHIANLKPDIAVIQECEKLEMLNLENEIVQPYSQHWFGDGQKGLGIFSFTEYTIHPYNEYDSSIRHCVPVHVKGKTDFNLIAVWAMNHKQRRLSYIAQVYLGIEKYKNLIKQRDTIVMGDFNFNKIWDDTPRIANFSKVVDELEKDGISSIYHEYFREPYGKETKNTLYMYRKQDKGFHIDYCFAPKSWLRFLKSVQIGHYDFWCKLSDHCPLIIDFDERVTNFS
ncbi:MAG: endonuclease/exonuclease/phosphatase family protein [Calditrichaeota bacterium]|nr:endonuclease/exonuclease/phosphatase family protein [Calditrichota bacterium]